ncbi:SDR family NAD(P)-dependent oxidoreductase, partial [Escherichia coli]|uniref:SDR family NAD(P)-dependent oxidoreductase n=1 Tax=Escherichia coli TaxID=562 RepID=UPI003FA55894
MPTPNSSKPLSIVITGATSGIGLQLAMDYLSQGHDMYTVGRNSDVLHRLAAMGAKTIQLDLTEYDAVMQAFSDIKTLDLFIAAAGVCEYIDMPNFDSRSIMRVMNANYGSLVHAIEALLPALK